MSELEPTSYDDWLDENGEFINQFLYGEFSFVQEEVIVPLFKKKFGFKKRNSTKIPLNLPSYLSDIITLNLQVANIRKERITENIGGMVIRHNPLLIVSFVGDLTTKNLFARKMSFHNRMAINDVLHTGSIKGLERTVAPNTPLFQLKQIDYVGQFVVIGPVKPKRFENT
jgi:hypothetical protein